MKLLALAFLLPAAVAHASSPQGEFDLSPRGSGVLADVPLELAPDHLAAAPSGPGLAVAVFRDGRHGLAPVAGLKFSSRQGSRRQEALTDEAGTARFTACTAGTVELTAELANDHFSITNGDKPYQLRFEAACGTSVEARFDLATNGGQALGIWQIAQLAMTKLDASVGLPFWSSAISFVWPAEADYYSWGAVHITKGQQWDVVGHELGHAIYDQGNLGQFGGGAHKIDECYTEAMALSEGWASYFSGWLSVALDDADAKFEFMVPRRAPIRFESIPADVCKGEKNEWRVTAFFWDLVDLNSDGETSSETFARVWNAMKDSRVGTTHEAADRLERAGLERSVLNLVWELNFGTTRP